MHVLFQDQSLASTLFRTFASKRTRMAQVLLTARFGRMNFDSHTKLMQADTRKGVLMIVKDDHMVHFQWRLRHPDNSPSETADVDFIIFPFEATFVKLPQPGARVFELRFEDKSRDKLFFWAQEPKAEMDEEWVSKINQAINTPLGAEDDDGDANMGEDDANGPLLAGGATDPLAAPGATPANANPHGPLHTPAAPAPRAPQGLVPGSDAGGAGAGGAAKKRPLVEADAFRRLMDQFATPGGAAATPAAPGLSGGGIFGDAGFLDAAIAAARGGRRAAAEAGPGLPEVLRGEALRGIFSEPAIQARLIPHLPEEHRTVAGLMELAQSPQFVAALSTLSHALQTGEVDPRSFGVEADGYGLEAFLRALDKKGEKRDGQ